MITLHIVLCIFKTLTYFIDFFDSWLSRITFKCSIICENVKILKWKPWCILIVLWHVVCFHNHRNRSFKKVYKYKYNNIPQVCTTIRLKQTNYIMGRPTRWSHSSKPGPCHKHLESLPKRMLVKANIIFHCTLNTTLNMILSVTI